MTDPSRTNQELIEENALLKQRIQELEHSESELKQAEEELRTNRRQLTDIIEFLPDATLGIDKKGRIIIWNKAIEKMTGIPAAKMIGKGNYAYTIPFYGEARPQLMDLIFEDHDEIAARYPNITREGNTLMAQVFCHVLYNNKGAWVFAKASPLHDQSGNIIGAIESIRDVTEQKRAEEALGESESRLKLTLEAVNDGVWDWNIPTGKAVFSSSYYTMLGYKPYEFPQNYESWRNLVHPDDIDRAEREINERIANNEGYSLEIRLRMKTGDWCWILIRGRTVEWDIEGNPIRMVGTHSDITERKQSEKALLESEERYRSLVNNIDFGINLIDKDFKIITHGCPVKVC